MVNNALLGLAAVVLISVFGVGVFVGMQLGGGGIAAPAEPTPAGTATPTAASGTPAATPTATATPPQTATPASPPEPTPTEAPQTIPVTEFDEENISQYLAQYLNENRTEQGLGTLNTEGNTADTVETMAQNHTNRMADEMDLSHTIDGVTSEDRYEYYNIESTCSFDVTETPSGNELEAIAMTVAGQPYTDGGEQRINEEDADVARALLDQMLADDDYRDRLLQSGAGRMGVGVAITDQGDVYATVNTCS